MFRMSCPAEEAESIHTIPKPPAPRPYVRPRLSNEQRLILANAEQMLQEFCLDFQVKSDGSCDDCPLYLPGAGRCAKGIVGQAKNALRCPQSTTEGGEAPCRS